MQQVVIGSFVPANEVEAPKPKKAKYEHTISFGAIPVSEERYDEANYGRARPNFASSASYHGENLPSVSSVHHSKISDNEDPRVQSHEIVC